METVVEGGQLWRERDFREVARGAREVKWEEGSRWRWVQSTSKFVILRLWAARERV